MIDNATRTYLLDQKALTTDSAGREVLHGLTYQETQEFLSEACIGKRKIALSNKHERARLAVLNSPGHPTSDGQPRA